MGYLDNNMPVTSGGSTALDIMNVLDILKNQDLYQERLKAIQEATKALNDGITNKRGYAIQAYTDNSYAVVTYATNEVTKYQHFEDIPRNIGEKLAMFKVIDANEPYSHLCMRCQGVDAFYIVDGETKTEQ